MNGAFFLGCQLSLPGTRLPKPTHLTLLLSIPKFLPLQNCTKNTGNKWSSFVIYWNVGFCLLRFTDFSPLKFPTNMPWKLVEDSKCPFEIVPFKFSGFPFVHFRGLYTYRGLYISPHVFPFYPKRPPCRYVWVDPWNWSNRNDRKLVYNLFTGRIPPTYIGVE